jgi:hypothetical protein
LKITESGIVTLRIWEYSSKICLNFVSSNLNFGNGVLQEGQGVNIVRLVVARPAPATAMRGIIAEDELKAGRERKLFGDLLKAPAGDFGDAVDISGKPARAI